jgi:flavodoxin
LVLYSSKTGNTEKVAQAIRLGLEEAGVQVTMKKPKAAAEIDYFNFDLVCVGPPAIQWHPTKHMDDFLKAKMAEYRKQGKIKPTAPKIAGKNVLVFVTYTGPHTGMDEATPVGKYLGQFFAHVGFNILDEWYILGEYHGNEENSTQGRMGDVRGKPTIEELQKVQEDAKALAGGI